MARSKSKHKRVQMQRHHVKLAKMKRLKRTAKTKAPASAAS